MNCTARFLLPCLGIQRENREVFRKLFPLFLSPELFMFYKYNPLIIASLRQIITLAFLYVLLNVQKLYKKNEAIFYLGLLFMAVIQWNKLIKH